MKAVEGKIRPLYHHQLFVKYYINGEKCKSPDFLNKGDNKVFSKIILKLLTADGHRWPVSYVGRQI